MPPFPPSALLMHFQVYIGHGSSPPSTQRNRHKDSLASSCNSSRASSIPSPTGGLGCSSSGEQYPSVILKRMLWWAALSEGGWRSRQHNLPAHQRLCRSDRWHPAGPWLWKDTVPNNSTANSTNSTCSTSSTTCNTSHTSQPAGLSVAALWATGKARSLPPSRAALGEHANCPSLQPFLLPYQQRPSLSLTHRRNQRSPKWCWVRMTGGFGSPHEEVEWDRWWAVPPVPMASWSVASCGEASKE